LTYIDGNNNCAITQLNALHKENKRRHPKQRLSVLIKGVVRAKSLISPADRLYFLPQRILMGIKINILWGPRLYFLPQRKSLIRLEDSHWKVKPKHLKKWRY
jgi:hypothetical protein